MRVLVTGGLGTLGRALTPLLVAAGHEPVIFDLPQPTPREDRATTTGPVQLISGDIRNGHDVRSAAEGVDHIIHAAAIHGIHLATHTPRDFHDLNVTGTFNVWEAALAERVKGLVFSSTMGVYGESRRPTGQDDVVAVHEDLPLLPTDIYGLSKVVGEEMCKLHLRADHIPSVALRFGMFVPEPFFRYGIRLLYGGVDERDSAGSVMAAMDAIVAGRVEHDAFNVESLLPFGPAHARDLRRDPLVALERHSPGSSELLRSRGLDTLKPITERFVMERIDQRLGFRPEHNFVEWLAELERRPTERAQADPAWP
jgi:nucleoside-diphosphate-sugar epimerase